MLQPTSPMKRRSMKIAYDGNVFEACKLKSDAIAEILTPNPKGRRYTALNPRPDDKKSKSNDSSNSFDDLPEPPTKKHISMVDKTKTV